MACVRSIHVVIDKPLSVEKRKEPLAAAKKTDVSARGAGSLLAVRENRRPSRTTRFLINLHHQQRTGEHGDKARNGSALDDFDRGNHGDTRNKNRHTGERGGRTTGSASEEGEAAQTFDRHAEVGRVRGHGFVERKRGLCKMV